jgi:hypothetical protein
MVWWSQLLQASDMADVVSCESHSAFEHIIPGKGEMDTEYETGGFDRSSP